MQLTFFSATVIFTASRIPKKKRIHEISREMFTGRKAVFQKPYHFIALHSACINNLSSFQIKSFTSDRLRTAIFRLCQPASVSPELLSDRDNSRNATIKLEQTSNIRLNFCDINIGVLISIINQYIIQNTVIIKKIPFKYSCTRENCLTIYIS